jgi:2'-5' RNA ligase
MNDGATLPTIRYADTSSWEQWQRDYRYGAFYIFPPPGLIEPIDTLRNVHDPKSAAACQAHISLSAPQPQPLAASDLAELQARLSKIEPFEVHYGPLRDFLPYPGDVFAITPEDRFQELRSAIHRTSLFGGTQLKRAPIAPHMTIAEFISIGRTVELVQELRGQVREGAFFCDTIEYAVPNSAFYFERVLTILLGKARQAGAITSSQD